MPRIPVLARRAVAPGLLLLLLLSLLSWAGPTRPADAGTSYLPPSEVVRRTEDGNVPDCGSDNIDGFGIPMTQGYSPAEWSVTSSYGSGSTVKVGDTWTVKARLHQQANFGLFMMANDGVDPLDLTLTPTGPVAEAVPAAGAQDPDAFTSGGNGEVGPVAPKPWGYRFDQNASPTGILPGDGVGAIVTVTMRATAPGVITLPRLRVTGHDPTPPAGDVDCSVTLNWSWNVEPVGAPVGGPDTARTDARYDLLAPGEANGGVHGITIPVLADDDDPNIAGGPGDPAQVRIADWQPVSVHGGQISCGTAQQKGLPATDASFTQLSTGPCTYRPPVGYAGPDSFVYVLRQKTGNTSVQVKVSIDVVANAKPVAAPAVFGTTSGTDTSFDLGPSIAVGAGETATCQAALVSAPFPAVGTVTLNPDCTFGWDNTNPGFTGNVSFSYRVCDTHPLLADGAHGDGAKQAGYDQGTPDDLTATTSRRCTTGEATLSILGGLVAPPIGVKDVDVVDAGYAADGVGAYSVDLPVLANDVDPNGPAPTAADAGLAVLTAPDASEGTATVVGGDHIRFTPADGFAGPVSFTYRVCEDPADQNPPYQGFPVCGVGAVALEVIGNQAPAPEPDAVELAAVDTLVAVELDLAANDAEPDGEALACATSPVSVSAPAKVTSVGITADCDLLLDPVDTATGTIEVTYRVCDDHVLADPDHPRAPYGTDGRSPGDGAPRCATAVATVTLADQGLGPADDPWDLDPNPTCAADAASTVTPAAVSIDVTANDADLTAKGEAGPITLTAPPADDPVVSEAGGTVVGDQQGTRLLYTPPADFTGTDTFVYSVTDAIGKTCNGTVTVEVLGAEVPTDGTGGTGTGSGSTGGSVTGGAGSTGGSTVGSTATGGTLPTTGAESARLAGLAGLLLAAGAALVLLARRRRPPAPAAGRD